ncbi:hypothetical protein ACWGS9_32890 [Bradyrhizobium sp. Arg314]
MKDSYCWFHAIPARASAHLAFGGGSKAARQSRAAADRQIAPAQLTIVDIEVPGSLGSPALHVPRINQTAQLELAAELPWSFTLPLCQTPYLGCADVELRLPSTRVAFLVLSFSQILVVYLLHQFVIEMRAAVILSWDFLIRMGGPVSPERRA